MRIDVTAGQYLDILEEHAWPTVQQNDRLTRAQHVALYKSAKYSIEAPLVIGASLAGASPADIHTMRNIGVPLGIAFQLRDDLLGVFGDPAVTGKPAGDDLREGKRTVLIALAQKQLSKEEASRFDELLGNPNLTPEQIVSLQTSLVDCGAVEQLETIITEQVHQAKLVIDSYDFVPEIKEALNHLAEKVSQRSS
jgi:geranylgeranyl diphosphate synthase type I